MLTVKENPSYCSIQQVPQPLERENGYIAKKSSIGTFPDDEFKIRGVARYFFLVNPGSSQCSFQNFSPGTTSSWKDGQPFVAIVEGLDGCQFVQQIREAQQMGAVAVIGVAGEPGGYSSPRSISNAIECQTKASCKALYERMLEGDGWADDIVIPVVATFIDDVKDIQQHFNNQYQREYQWRERHREPYRNGETYNGEMLRLEMSFSPKSDDDAVKYEFWTLPGEAIEESLHFLKTFKHIASELHPKAIFTPHFTLFDGFKTGCRQNPNPYSSNTIPSPSWCTDLCIYDGHYCAYHPDPPLYPKLSGADIVKEIVRQSCIKSQYASKDKFDEAWWDYSIFFLKHCAQGNNHILFNSTKCINKAYDEAGIDASKIDLCIEYTRDESHESNPLLNAELLALEDRKVSSVPSTYVGNSKVEGGLFPENLFREICSQFPPHDMPKICQKCHQCANVLQCIRHPGHVCAEEEDDTTPVTMGSTSPPHTTVKMAANGHPLTGMNFCIMLVFGICGAFLFGQKRKVNFLHQN